MKNTKNSTRTRPTFIETVRSSWFHPAFQLGRVVRLFLRTVAWVPRSVKPKHSNVQLNAGSKHTHSASLRLCLWFFHSLFLFSLCLSSNSLHNLIKQLEIQIWEGLREDTIFSSKKIKEIGYKLPGLFWQGQGRSAVDWWWLVASSVVCYCACLPLLLVLVAAQPLSLRFALEQLHQLVHKIPSILHLKPTFSILHHHFYKTPTSVYLFYKIFQ